MITFLANFIRFILRLFQSKSSLLCENALLKKENDILLRKAGRKRIHINIYDKLFLIILNKAADIKERVVIVKPETLLHWERTIIKRFWTFKPAPDKRGRKPISTDIKNLILSMKNDNLLWGTKRIQGELLKLDIALDTKTIRNILRIFRNKGKIRLSLTWKKFLNAQIHSIYAMDFFTVDTLFNKRFHVFIIIAHKTREII